MSLFFNNPVTEACAYALNLRDVIAPDISTIRTNWTIITGAPSSGKSTILNMLQNRGHRTSPEMARLVLEDACKHGVTAEDILAKNPMLSQQVFCAAAYEQELCLDPELPVILDRSCLDSIAFIKAWGFDVPKNILPALGRFKYRQAILLKRLPFVDDGMRPLENDFYNKVEDQLFEIYSALNIPCTLVEPLPLNERFAEIEKLISSK